MQQEVCQVTEGGLEAFEPLSTLARGIQIRALDAILGVEGQKKLTPGAQYRS